MSEAAFKHIPIAGAKRIAQESGYPVIVVFAIDPETNKQHVTTYGVTLRHCEWAAKLGNNLKRALGWPEEECDAKPARVKRKERNAAKSAEATP